MTDTSEPLTRHARRVLFGTTLEDKLTPWPRVHLDGGEPLGPIAAPGRPLALALPTTRRDVRVKTADLQQEHGRASVLHELANHELQAIELIAMALLRWPDAPEGFRRGLVATLADEQRHCQLYLERLAACGGVPGQVPVSRFFWDTLSPVEHVQSFVAGLSLCFEVANLDFCLHWGERFASAGDPQTAAVLEVVHADEIRHIAHGHGWFRRWMGEDWVPAWVNALPPPLTPARSRGPRFDGPGRKAAGFGPEAIAALRVLGGSRGRPSRVFTFDAGIEDRIAGRSISRPALAVGADLAALPMFLARSSDLVVALAPSVGLLNELADAGFEIPRFVPDMSRRSIGPHPIAEFVPWGRSPAELPSIPTRSPLVPWNPAWAALSSKTETLRRSIGFSRRVVVLDDLGRVWQQVGEPPRGPWVIKAPFSASGTARIRGEGPLTPPQQAWLQKRLRISGEVVVQTWHDRVLDLSVHVDVGQSVQVVGLTRFQTSRGAYSGAWLGRWSQDLPAELQRWLHGDGDPDRAVEPLLREAARTAGAWAHDLGYRGPLSIDAMVVRSDSGWRVHPWLETNARHTLGRVALAMSHKVAPRSRGFWHVQRSTSASRRALAEARLARPVKCASGRIVSGVLATTEPGPTVLTWIEVSPDRP